LTEQVTNVDVQNRYQELIRVSRQMRKLEVLKRFGGVYGMPSSNGNLAIFCPSCPQPGINLPSYWKDLPDWVTRRTITVDGNFHADHIKMRRPEMDVMLTNGQGYMIEALGYNEYMNVAKDQPMVGLQVMLSVSILIYLTRGQHVAITELSIVPTLTIGAI
jgi:hypothetical protein